MICPVRRAQPWYPVLLEMVCETPRLLHPSISLPMSAQGEAHPLLVSGTLQLATRKLSGRISEGEAFRAIWSTIHQLFLLTSQHGKLGRVIIQYNQCSSINAV
jgi:hypothetical protein